MKYLINACPRYALASFLQLFAIPYTHRKKLYSSNWKRSIKLLSDKQCNYNNSLKVIVMMDILMYHICISACICIYICVCVYIYTFLFLRRCWLCWILYFSFVITCAGQYIMCFVLKSRNIQQWKQPRFGESTVSAMHWHCLYSRICLYTNFSHTSPHPPATYLWHTRVFPTSRLCFWLH